MEFTKATKKQSKLRLAIDGPSGSGKTYTALIAATALAKGGKIAVIDTERGSASLYSDKFQFDVLELHTFSPSVYVEAITSAEEAGYKVIVIDSLSHAWEGEGGALEMVDQAAKRSQSGNSYTAWKDITPIHRKMVDAMLQSPCHVIATMRSKTEYIIEQVEKNGRTMSVPKKIGMAPVQRQGMEYEFTVVCDMNTEHDLIVSKSRCELIADAVVNKPDGKWFKQIVDWLDSGEAVTQKPVTTTQQFSIPHSETQILTLEQALEEVGSDGKKYGECTVEELSKKMIGITKKLNGKLDAQEQDVYLRKLQAAKIVKKHLETQEKEGK